MKLLKDICGARGFTSCVALTYNVDLGWFERFVLRQLRRRGVRHFLVFADRARLSEAIDEDLDLLHGLGRSYAALGIQSAQSFHPKMLLLTGEDKARLYVGSGNLTSGGYARNREIFERWEVTQDDTSVPVAFETVRRFLDQLCAQHLESKPPAFVRAALDATFGVRVLAKPRDSGPQTEIWSSPGSLLGRVPRPPSPAARLRMLAPSFDRDGGAAITLARSLRAKTFQVITDLRTTNLTRPAYDAIRAAGGEVRFIDGEGERRLHAKVIVAEGEGWALSVCGSANLSHAAWQGANVELIAVRRDARAADVVALLDGLPTTELVPELRERLPETGDERTPEDGGPAIVDACWDGADTIVVTLAAGTEPPIGAETRSGGTARTALLASPPDEACQARVSCPEPAREAATAVRLFSVNGYGPWAVVHDAEELAEQARPESRAQVALRDLIDGDAFDYDAAEKLLELMTAMWQERQRRKAEATDAREEAAQGEPEEAGSPSKPDWCWIKPTDFAAPSIAAPPPAGQRSGSHPLPVNMLRHLLFGDEQNGDEDADEGESEPQADEGAPEGDPPATARATAREREKFLVAAEGAIKAYLGQLRSDDASRSPLRLLEDMRLLAALSHYAFVCGALTASQFRGHLIRLLHAFLGLRDAPFPSALEAIPADERPVTWSRAPVLLFGALLAYNTCLADLHVHRDERGVQKLLDDLALALWMRNLVRPAPPDAVDAAVAALEADLPRLRRGELWLGRAWPELVERIPFETFARRLMEDARDIVCAEQLILPLLGKSSEGPEPEDDDRVVAPGRDGSLACGWLEAGDNSDVLVALLYDSAFLVFDPSPAVPNARMHRIFRPRRLMPIETAFVRAAAAGEGGAAQRGIDALNRML